MKLAMRIVLLGMSLLLSGIAWATAQIPDRITIDGREYALNTNPLEPRLQGNRDFLPENVSRSTANWRGYVAYWAIDGQRLLLSKIEARLYDRENDRESHVDLLPKLFPEGGPVPADWYSGALVIPDGRMVSYVHMGYGSTWERYLVYRIDQGKVVEALSLDLEQFIAWREQKFQAFRQSMQYREAAADVRQRHPELGEEQVEGFLRNFFDEQYMGR